MIETFTEDMTDNEIRDELIESLKSLRFSSRELQARLRKVPIMESGEIILALNAIQEAIVVSEFMIANPDCYRDTREYVNEFWMGFDFTTPDGIQAFSWNANVMATAMRYWRTAQYHAPSRWIE